MKRTWEVVSTSFVWGDIHSYKLGYYLEHVLLLLEKEFVKIDGLSNFFATWLLLGPCWLSNICLNEVLKLHLHNACFTQITRTCCYMLYCMWEKRWREYVRGDYEVYSISWTIKFEFLHAKLNDGENMIRVLILP